MFGYDFMLVESGEAADTPSPDSPAANATLSCDDSSYRVHGRVDVKLLEINSSPAVAEKLMPRFVENLMEVVVDRIFPPDEISGNEESSLDTNTTSTAPGAGGETALSCTEREGVALFPERFIKVYDRATAAGEGGNESDLLCNSI